MSYESATEPRNFAPLTQQRYEDVLQAVREDPQQLVKLLANLHPADVADILERLPLKQREALLHAIAKENLPDVISELESGAKEHILSLLPQESVTELLDALESDDAVDVAQILEGQEEAEPADSLDRHEKRLLKYDPHTAGGLMQLEVLTALPHEKVSDILKYMRRNADELPDNPGTVFVVNERRKLMGTISQTRLVQCPLNARLEDVMRQKPLSLRPETPEDEVVRLFEKYDLSNCAVVNSRGALLGRITIDDVLDAVIEAHESELKRSAGLDAAEDLFAPITITTRHRMPWLIINLFTAIAASLVIALFQSDIERMVALAVLMPIIASMGGNAGTQTMTVAVRGLATGQMTMRNAVSLLWKELTVGSLNGTGLGILLALGTLVIYQDAMLSLVIFLATLANHIFAAISGHLIPIFLKKSGYDPAISSGVLVTTVTDVGGFFAFLGLASLLLL